jgi:hypothetical protein
VTAPDPFTVLGLPAGPGLSDEQVRAAWRSIATATHPDRPGGGDPVRYAAASAAYAVLRTAWGRSEAYADLTAQAPPTVAAAPRPAARVPARRLAHSLLLVPARIRHGRPWRLAVRVLAAAVLGVAAARSGAGGPAAAGMVAGLAIWLALTVRGDLAPPPGR